jgi:hypothetical protein
VPGPPGRRSHCLGVLSTTRRARHPAGQRREDVLARWDGGLYENQGIETLLFLYLKQIQAKRVKRALMLAFDSSYPFSVGERRLGLRS